MKEPIIRVRYEVVELVLEHAFQMARGTGDTTRQTVIARLGDGVGECTPIRYVGDSIEAVTAALDSFDVPDDVSVSSIGEVLDDFAGRNPHTHSALAGLDFALHDVLGKRAGQPVHQVLGIDASRLPATSYTIAIGPPDVIREKVALAEPYSILKVKVGSPSDWDTLRLVRSLTDKTIRVDANEGWTVATAIDMVHRLADFGVEFVEQPVPRDDLDALAAVTQVSPIPIIADETCQTFADVARLAGRAHGINIKLMKCGGIRQGLKMIGAARGYGMQVMLGCMIETSVGITAAAHLAPLVDYADLDGNLLITNDPFTGVTSEQGKLVLPTRPGLGVQER